MSINLQRTAWAVMLGAFLMFCGLCVTTVYGTYLFMFQSTVPMNAIAQASRGSIGITGLDLREDVERGSRALALGNIVRPNDQESQGVILIQDPYRDNAFVTSLNLIGDSTATLRSALRPRFDWGSSSYWVEVERVTGKIEIIISPEYANVLEIELTTEQRARVTLDQPGRYIVDVRASSIIVESHGGTALIYGPDKTFGYSVTAGSSSIYSIPNDDIRAQQPRDTLLLNSDFSATQSQQSSPEDLLERQEVLYAPLSWVCSHSANPPRDTFTVETQDGRNVFRMTRGGGATSNGETTCTQGLAIGTEWQNIADYTTLSLHASMYLNYQSLGSCGIQGSECPLMLRLNYIYLDEQGDFANGELVYGFYAVPALPEQQFPQTCESCFQPHIRVQEKTWYVFDSGNILAGIPPERRPVAISRLRFYASGHEYDVRVSRVELIGARAGG